MKVAVIRYKYVNYGGAEGFVDQYTNQLVTPPQSQVFTPQKCVFHRNRKKQLEPVANK